MGIRSKSCDIGCNPTSKPLTMLTRSLSENLHSPRKYVAINGKSISFSSQSTLKVKYFKNKTELFILMAMMMMYFIGMCAFSMIAPFFPKEAKHKGINETMTGLIFAVYPLVMFLVSPFVGKFMPLMGVKFTLLVGCFLAGGSEILFGFVADISDEKMFFCFCFLIRTVTAIGSACSQISVLLICSVTFEENLSKVLSLLEVFTGVGLMAGPALGGLLYKFGGFKLPFIAVGCLTFVVLISVYFILPTNIAQEKQDLEDGSPKTGSFFKIFFIPAVFILFTVVVLSGTVLSFLDPTLAGHLNAISNNSLSVEQIGFIFMIAPSIYTVFAIVVGCIANKIRGMYLIAIGGFSLFVAFFMMGPSPFVQSVLSQHLWLTCIALVIMGISIAFFFIPILYNMQAYARIGTNTDDLKTASIVSGIFNSGFSIGSVIGPTFGGVLTTHMSFDMASTIFSLILLGEVLVLIIFIAWERYTSLRLNIKHGKENEEKTPLIT